MNKVYLVLVVLYVGNICIGCPTDWSLLDATSMAQVPPTCFQNATAVDIFELEASACSSINETQIQNLPSSSMAGFRSTCFQNLNATIFQFMSEFQVTAIPVEAFAVITNSQMSSFSNDSCKGITYDQIFVLQDCSGVTAECFSWWQSVESLTTACIQTIDPECIGARWDIAKGNVF
jgi:hypothetical protein